MSSVADGVPAPKPIFLLLVPNEVADLVCLLQSDDREIRKRRIPPNTVDIYLSIICYAKVALPNPSKCINHKLNARLIK